MFRYFVKSLRKLISMLIREQRTRAKLPKHSYAEAHERNEILIFARKFLTQLSGFQQNGPKVEVAGFVDKDIHDF